MVRRESLPQSGILVLSKIVVSGLAFVCVTCGTDRAAPNKLLDFLLAP